MFEDAPVNTAAVADTDSAFWTVRRTQLKLHRWASEDHTRRFGDLFNLVYDPAFLTHAWERVPTNAGARTAGMDRVTVAQIVARVEVFLGQIRDLLKSGKYEPVQVRGSRFRRRAGKPLLSWGSRPWPTGWFRPASRRYWKPIRGRLRRARTGSGRTAARRTRSPRSTSGSHFHEWVLEADIQACFDEIDTRRYWNGCGSGSRTSGSSGWSERSEVGVMTTSGVFEDTLTGTPQGGSSPAAGQHRPLDAGRPLRPSAPGTDGQRPATGSTQAAWPGTGSSSVTRTTSW